MKIFNFPCLIQREIFEQLHPSELLFLSFCSARTKQLIKGARSQQCEIIFDVQRKNNIMFHIHNGKPNSKCSVLNILNEPFFPRKGDLNIIKLPNNLGIYCKGSWESEHLTDYDEIRIQLQTSLKPNMIKKSKLTGEIPPLFFTDHSDQELCIAENLYRRNAMSGDDPILSINNIYVKNICCRVQRMLLFFKGEHAFLETDMYDPFMINMFLKFWAEKTDDKLQSMIVYMSNQKDWELNIFSNMEKVSLKRDSIYPYNSLIKEHYEFSADTFDCSTGFEVKRADGRIGTVKKTTNYFMFFVWND
ncbi:hypothetical protein GCK72_022066 [Caenorhabditis remanei]|uniref:F-box domain-containing protein n=1 Tax=Caenorhabditis remanei TaxID=31234 RepID=A0A6A5FSW8_CAERE|nr:hypothetical protein GCK72_022066 [Caenorhabditis remanei]KAF1745619.1 hypothetical protein GCK72_022066 [Caenorhabditis remanei]